MSYETYFEKQQRTLCENSSKLTNNIVNPKCYDGKKEYKVTISYNDIENDILFLCANCMKTIKKEGRKHGYKVIVRGKNEKTVNVW